MQVTDAMLAAAITKAVELGILHRTLFQDHVERDRRKVRQVLEAALAASDDVAHAVPFEDCTHPPEAIAQGPRIPLRWGSGPTEVCRRCGAWRSTLYVPGPWRPGPVWVAREELL